MQRTLFEMEPLEESGLKLNEAQRRAVTHGEGPLLVIAGKCPVHRALSGTAEISDRVVRV